jgi:simple sugar transport system permease protein
VLAGVLAVVLASLLTTTVGVSPVDALRELWNGAFGSDYQVGVTLTKALPLAFVALGFTIAFRTGLFNIGLEGQLYAGGLSAGLVGAHMDAPAAIHLPVAILAAALGGAAWALIPALLRIGRGVNEIVTSLLLNYAAIYLTDWLISGPVKDPAAIYPQTPRIASSAELPVLVEGTKITAGVILAVAVAVVLWFLMARTAFGYQMTAVGTSPRVARYAGIPVRRTMLIAFLVSGAMGGLAGGVEILGNQYRVVQDFSASWGYTGIAVALLGMATPVGCLVAALYFGILGAGAEQLQFRLGVPASLALIVQALAVILVLAAGWLRHTAGLRLVRRRAQREKEEPGAPGVPQGADP